MNPGGATAPTSIAMEAFTTASPAAWPPRLLLLPPAEVEAADSPVAVAVAAVEEDGKANLKIWKCVDEKMIDYCSDYQQEESL